MMPASMISRPGLSQYTSSMFSHSASSSSVRALPTPYTRVVALSSRRSRVEHGALTKGAVSTVDGTRVIAIDDDGRAPGASPSTAYVALSGPPLLVRVVVRGATTPGGRVDCGHPANDTGPPTVSATYDFAEWGAAVSITPPPNVSSGPAV